jgi:O-methyltransferase involved in polyketide biosynthesis
MNQPRAGSNTEHGVIRSRFAEDRLAAAVGEGVRQLVALGAGYDTFAYRQPPWAAALQIFEVDHAASQRASRGFPSSTCPNWCYAFGRWASPAWH